MALDKQDFKEIKKIVDGSIEKAIEKSEVNMSDKIEFLIEKSEMRTGDKIDKLGTKVDQLETKVDQLDSKLDNTRQEILQKIDREITDTAGVNRAQIKTIVNHDRRIIKIEKKIGIAI